MNNNQKQVIDNTSLVGFIGSRPFFPESDSRGLNSYRNNEGKASGGGVGTGIKSGDVSGWASATSKPFGSVFKPKRPNEDKTLDRDCKSQPIRSLRNVKPFVSEPIKPRPQAITVAQLEIAKSIEGNVQRTMDICDFINAKLGLCRLKPTVKRRLEKVEPLPDNAKPLRGNRFEEVWLRELSNE